MIEKAGYRLPNGTRDLLKAMTAALKWHVSDGGVIALGLLRLADDLASDATLGPAHRSAVAHWAAELRTVLGAKGLGLELAEGSERGIILDNPFDADGKLALLNRFAREIPTQPKLAHLRIGKVDGNLLRVFAGTTYMPFGLAFVPGDQLKLEIYVDLKYPPKNEACYADWYARKADLQRRFGAGVELLWEGPWRDTKAFRVAAYVHYAAEQMTPEQVFRTGLDLLTRFDRAFGDLIPPGRSLRTN